MCRDYIKEYGVSCFWELSPEVIEERETHWKHEFTPMTLVNLIELCPQHDIIICEGDIDYETVIPIASHAVYLSNRGTKFDWFNRPDHSHALDSVTKRTDLSRTQKDEIIRNAYSAVAQSDAKLPSWVTEHSIKNIVWDDNTTIEITASEVARYFDF